MKRKQDDLYNDEIDILIDTCCDWIAMRWTKSMIAAELRSYFPNISYGTIQAVITRARRRIQERYKVSPEEFKGEMIELYSNVIRGKKIKRTCKELLQAAAQLEDLLGLKHISLEDPEELARKIIAFKQAAKESVGGQQQQQEAQNGDTQSERQCEDKTTDAEDDDQLTQEQIDELTHPKKS